MGAVLGNGPQQGNGHGTHDARLVDVDGVHCVIGGETVGTDIPVLSLHHLGPHGNGPLRRGVPKLNVPDNPPHQPQIHGSKHLSVGVLDLLLDADIQLKRGFRP